MSDETTLLPCICGGKASLKVLEYGDGCKVWGVFCESDLASEYSHGHFIDNYATEAEAIAAWNTRATHGTLTAEQVETAINNHCQFTVGCVVDAQAIADELNARAELTAERTCEPKWVLQGTTQTQEFWRCECGNCGECFGVEDRSSFPFKMTIDKVEAPNYCPNCGCKVVSK